MRFPRVPCDALDAQSIGRRVLVLGALAANVRTEVTAAGAVITDASDPHHAFELLAANDYDAGVFDPTGQRDALFVHFAVKDTDDGHRRFMDRLYGPLGDPTFMRGSKRPTRELYEAARRRHRTTAFFMLPLDGKDGYTIMVFLPGFSFSEEPSGLPLATALLRFDASRLIVRPNWTSPFAP